MDRKTEALIQMARRGTPPERVNALNRLAAMGFTADQVFSLVHSQNNKPETSNTQSQASSITVTYGMRVVINQRTEEGTTLQSRNFTNKVMNQILHRKENVWFKSGCVNLGLRPEFYPAMDWLISIKLATRQGRNYMILNKELIRAAWNDLVEKYKL